MTTSNSRCDHCDAGRLVTYKTRTSAEHRTRYLRCNQCGTTAKQTLSLKRGEFVPTVGTDIIDTATPAATIRAQELNP